MLNMLREMKKQADASIPPIKALRMSHAPAGEILIRRNGAQEAGAVVLEAVLEVAVPMATKAASAKERWRHCASVLAVAAKRSMPSVPTDLSSSESDSPADGHV